jgi:hypothetical protein
MYNQPKTIALQNETNNWLAGISLNTAEENASSNIDFLKEILRFHEYRYYVNY